MGICNEHDVLDYKKCGVCACKMLEAQTKTRRGLLYKYERNKGNRNAFRRHHPSRDSVNRKQLIKSKNVTFNH